METSSVSHSRADLPGWGLSSDLRGSRVPVVHAYNPSYSGGRDQKDHGSKPAWTNNLEPYLEKTLHKKGLVELLKV
jgi:hypothetical protein